MITILIYIPDENCYHLYQMVKKNLNSLNSWALTTHTEVAQPQLISSETLFMGAKELLIEHRAEIYRLRQTSQGKLILTK